MDNWHKRILLSLSGLLLTSTILAQETIEQVVVPDIDRRVITTDDIDTENFALSIHAGIISIEDFETTDLLVVRGDWYVTEDLFLEISYSTATGDLTSYEELVGGTPLFADEQRDFTQYNLSLGYNIFPGQAHFSDSLNFNTNFYVVIGAGNTDFLGDEWFTVTYGAGYQILLTDYLAVHLDMRDHVFDRATFGTEETTNNIELSMGLSYFF
ncbi:MAG: outer membrane beta-barrel protein [Pseudohongiellaceae bacterium]|jgi:outer membrane beta-barrel protein